MEASTRFIDDFFEGHKKSLNKFPAIYQKFTGLFNILQSTEMAPTT
jgi:hypothetical protein